MLSVDKDVSQFDVVMHDMQSVCCRCCCVYVPKKTEEYRGLVVAGAEMLRIEKTHSVAERVHLHDDLLSAPRAKAVVEAFFVSKAG